MLPVTPNIGAVYPMSLCIGQDEVHCVNGMRREDIGDVKRVEEGGIWKKREEKGSRGYLSPWKVSSTQAC